MQETHNSPDDVEDGQTPSGSGKSRSGLILMGCLVILVIVVLVFGVPYYRYLISHETTDDAFVEGHVVPISARVPGQVAAVHVTDNQWVNQGDLLVELDPRDFQVKLAEAEAEQRVARASHKTSTISVDLTKITSPAGVKEASANVQTAKATIATAKAQVAAAISQRDQARARLAAARAGLAQVRAELAVVEAKYQRDHADLVRYREMAKTNIITRQQLDHAAASERMAAADVDAAKRRVDTQRAAVEQVRAALKSAADNLQEAKAHLAARRAELDQSKARLAGAQAVPEQVAYSQSQADVSKAQIAKAATEVERAQLDLSYTRITAPGPGYVTRKTVEPGAYVHVGQALMAIVRVNVWVVANFKETQLTHMQIGQPVEIEIDSYPGAVFKGRVDSIQRGTGARFSLLPPENATGNYVKVVQRVPVKIVFDDQQQLQKYLLVPGMSVVPNVNIASRDSAATPRATVRGAANAAQSQNPSR